jgi:ABC-type glycerol-3-phosphate transport system substrate-binding protein
MTKFQAILIAVFVLFIVIGVAVFATYKGSQSATALPSIEVWGTFSSTAFNELLEHVNQSRPEAIRVNYVQKTPAQFDKDFIATLARGGGPSAILLPQEMLLKHLDKILPIPSTVLTDRTFTDTYISEAQNYLSPNGVLALPLAIDPMVMYWNRDIFTNAGLATYPKSWSEFSALNKVITVKDQNSNIRKSAVALGEFSNITNAREILGTLLMQAGNPVVTVHSQTASDGTSLVQVAQSALGDSAAQGSDSTNAALSFFTKFSNPSDPDYSWNRSLSDSKNAFLSGSLATYFGFASELPAIREKNPNLNFDVAGMPQAKNNRATYGTMYGFSIVRTATDPTSTYTILSALTDAAALQYLTTTIYLPPVRTDLIAAGTADKYLSIFYDSALISKGWLDPDVSGTYAIMQEMVESVTSGRKDSFDAIKTADTKLNLLISNQ